MHVLPPRSRCHQYLLCFALWCLLNPWHGPCFVFASCKWLWTTASAWTPTRTRWRWMCGATCSHPPGLARAPTSVSPSWRHKTSCHGSFSSLQLIRIRPGWDPFPLFLCMLCFINESLVKHLGHLTWARMQLQEQRYPFFLVVWLPVFWILTYADVDARLQTRTCVNIHTPIIKELTL